jgi:hypothetical protein
MPRSDISCSYCDGGVRGRVRLKNGDRLFFIQLYRWFPSILRSTVRPETIMRWHRCPYRKPKTAD